MPHEILPKKICGLFAVMVTPLNNNITVRCSLHCRCNLTQLVTSVKQCWNPSTEPPTDSQLLTRNAFQISFQPDWQINNGLFNTPIMARTQILVHRLEAQNKDFRAVSRTDLTRVQFRLWRRLSVNWPSLNYRYPNSLCLNEGKFAMKIIFFFHSNKTYNVLSYGRACTLPRFERVYVTRKGAFLNNYLKCLKIHIYWIWQFLQCKTHNLFGF